MTPTPGDLSSDAVLKGPTVTDAPTDTASDASADPVHGFIAKTVEEQTKVKLDPDEFKPARVWVTPEPGAGLIRDTPKLIAPTELFAYPGRGGLLVYKLDEKGEALVAFGRAIARQGNRVPEEIYRKIAGFFSAEQIVVLTAFAGLMVATNIINNVLEVELDQYLYEYRKGKE